MSLNQLTDEHHLFRKTINRWVEQQLTPQLKDMEENYTSDPRLLSELHELGFLSAGLSEELGGASGDLLMNVVLLEELGKAGGVGFAQIIKQHALALSTLSKFKETQHLLTQEIENKSIFTFVTHMDEGSTTLPFVINGMNANLCVVHRPNLQRLDLYNINDKHIEIEKDNYYMGWRTANIATIHLGQVQPVMTIEIDLKESEEITALEQVLDAAIITGVIQITLKKTIQYAKERTQFNGPLTQFQVLRHKLVDIAIESEKLRNFLYYVTSTNRDETFLTMSSLLRMFTEQIAPSITDTAQQLFGGNGYMMEFDIQRYWRDCQMYSVINNENFCSYEEIGNKLLNA